MLIESLLCSLTRLSRILAQINSCQALFRDLDPTSGLAWLASWYNMFVSQTLKRSDQRGGLDTRDGIVQTRIFLGLGCTVL